MMNKSISMTEEFLASNQIRGEILDSLQRFARKLGLQAEDFTGWTFWGSWFYSATICTSIGYGNMTPKTQLGRSLTMIYAVFGIPLLLYTLSYIGQNFCYGIWYFYLLVNRIFTGNRLTRTEAEDIGRFPFWAAICLTLVWILMCAAIFTTWENWDFFTSFYFFFQSLTTIGFGDVIPQEPRNMVVGFILIVVGMGFVSMCWNLMQIKVAYFVDKIFNQIRDKYVQTEFNDLTLTEDRRDILSEIRTMSSSESVWLSRMMGQQQQSSLVDEWLRRAGQLNKGIQVACSTADVQLQSTPSLMNASSQSEDPPSALHQQQKIPQKEIFPKKGKISLNTDECRYLFKQISDILEDCHNMLSISTNRP